MKGEMESGGGAPGRKDLQQKHGLPHSSGSTLGGRNRGRLHTRCAWLPTHAKVGGLSLGGSDLSITEIPTAESAEASRSVAARSSAAASVSWTQRMVLSVLVMAASRSAGSAAAHDLAVNNLDSTVGMDDRDESPGLSVHPTRVLRGCVLGEVCDGIRHRIGF